MTAHRIHRPPRAVSLRRRAVLVPVVLAAMVSPAAPAGSRACTRTCKVPVAACVRCVRAEMRTARAACAGPRSARHRCRTEAAADAKSSMARCRPLGTSCLACCRAGGASCSTSVDPVCPIGRHVGFTPPPRRDPATLPLPPAGDGKLVVLQVPGGRLDIDPAQRGPLTVLGRCTAWIAACVAPPDRTLDDCARSAPTCSGTTPWDEPQPCCPSGCFAAYRRARMAAPPGESPLDTFTRVYFDDAACFPGVRAAVGR